jgi:hypothetical protein
MNIMELSKKEFQLTFSEKMKNITNEAEAVVDIWKYVKMLDKSKYFINDYIIENEFVENVYRNSENTFDQILISTTEKNIFLVVVVNILEESILGHYLLDLNEEYGIKK